MVHLTLNADLIRARKCRDLLDALEIAAGKRSIPHGWFQWLAETPREAAELELSQAVDVLARD